MTERRKRIDNAIRESKNSDIMDKLKRDEGFRLQVITWMFSHDYHKAYSKCSQCDAVGDKDGYHGKLCKECTSKYRRCNYAEKNPEIKRIRKPRSVTFKKGTKKN